jgi:K(+)-stimulated pyrophosphate-energized sodium pump
VAYFDRLGRAHLSRLLPDRPRPRPGGDNTLWWKLGAIISCGTLAGAVIPELVKVFTSTESGHVKEVVTSSREGGASLNILSGLVAGNFSGYWLGISIVALMSIAYYVSLFGLGALMVAPPSSPSASSPSASSAWGL